ncbi:MAG TPA: TIGR04290 family methyltransferase [Candidatus Limnocylindrales bacterium]|nr:TIGR04290 family methyltransferase [Candidatus Limnocylindrales bacterium]
MGMASHAATDVHARVQDLAPWFHNLHLPDGTETRPDHTFGDFPSNKWEAIRHCVPEDLSGWTALDIGCNAGFYSFELARRGACVTAIDHDRHYLEQACWAAEQYGLQDRIQFREMQIYDLARVGEQFDLVWFMGVFYHLRYPLLGLDIVSRRTRRLLIFQTMTLPGEEVQTPPYDLPLAERHRMTEPGWPKMAFIEKRVEADPTNWWAADHACVEAMLRSCGMKVLARPAHEVYVCEPTFVDRDGIGEQLDREYEAATGIGRRRDG